MTVRFAFAQTENWRHVRFAAQPPSPRGAASGRRLGLGGPLFAGPGPVLSCRVPALHGVRDFKAELVFAALQVN